MRIADGHRRGVPHFGKPEIGLREHLAELQLRHVLGPGHGPLPLRTRFDIGDQGQIGIFDAPARQPCDRRADLGLDSKRREVKARLHRIGVLGHRDAVATRPERVLAVLVHHGVVIEGEGRRGGVEGRLRTSQAVDRRGRQHHVADDVAAGHWIFYRKPRDGEGLHAALAVFGIHHHHQRLGDLVPVEVVAKRPDDIAAVVFHESVLFVRVVSNLARRVLVVDFRCHAVLGGDVERKRLGRAGAGHGAVAARQNVALRIHGGANRPVRACGREIFSAEVEVAEGYRAVLRPCRVAVPEREIVERHESRGVFRRGIRRAERGRHGSPENGLGKRDTAVAPLAGRYGIGRRRHAVHQEDHGKVAFGALLQHGVDRGDNLVAVLAKCPPCETAGRRHRVAAVRDVRRHVAREADIRRRIGGRNVRRKTLSTEIDARSRVRLDKQQRASVAGGHVLGGRAELRRKRNLRQKPMRQRRAPRHAVVLHKRRIVDRGCHALRLEVRAPPYLYLRVVHAVDAIDRGCQRFKRIV